MSSYSQSGTATGLKGTGYQAGQLQQFTPEQLDLFKRLFGQVGPDSQLAQLAGGDQGAFEQLEKPALRQFNELQGGLASRFSGAGGLGARNSSGFQNASSSAASNFAQELQSNRLGLQRQAQQDLFSMSNDLLNQRPYENFLLEKAQKDPSFLERIFGSLLGGVGQFGGNIGTQYASKKLGLT